MKGKDGFVGDSPGEPFEVPDEPVASDEPGTTAEEQRERSLERRLAMDEPDISSGFAEEADVDRMREEIGEWSFDPAESAEESAMHIERE